MVPDAEFRSYYGRPILAEPAWKVPDVPAYLYLGGLAGASASMAGLADATGSAALRRAGRLTAAAAALASVGALVHDLGRPTRFLNMLRVLRPTSPLSVGSWILAPFSGLASATAASELTGMLPGLARASGAGAAVLGPAMSTYTAVLLADTAVPSWHEAYPELPFVFAGSALGSAGGMGMATVPVDQALPARRMALLGSVLELAASRRIESRLGLLAEPYLTGRPGTLLRVGKVCTAAGALGTALLGRRSRAASVVSGLLVNAGALATRFGVFEAGVASTRDPKYVVLPQRERLAARQPPGLLS
jgi:hypothetical protein